MNQVYPAVNSTKDLNSNLLLDDYTQLRDESQKRDNLDFKINWQLRPGAMVWGKFGYMKNEGTGNNFVLGFDNPSIGDTRSILTTFGTTWTLGPVDGARRQLRHEPAGPDGAARRLRDELRPAARHPRHQQPERHPRERPADDGQRLLGYRRSPNWMPLWRKEISYSGTVGLTKVFTNHEIRAGMDFVRLELNHRQAEWGDYGLKGGFSFSNNTTGAVGYTSPGYNNFAAFLLGLPNYYAEDTQTEEMTGRENQFAFYVRDRWTVSPKLTVSGGLRLEHYPLMTRVGRGIEILDYNTYQVTLGGIGGQPKDVGIDIKTWYMAPRVGASYRLNENTVLRAGYGMTINPLPWSRPMRGSYPFDINNNATAAGTYDYVTTLATGIPAVKLPDTSTGIVLPRGVYIRTPNPDDVDRGQVQQWNVSVERKVFYDIAVEVAYVGTATDGGYADLNRERRRSRRRRHGGGVLRVGRHDGHQRVERADQEPLQGPADRREPSVQERPDAQGRLHLEPVEEHGRRRRVDGPHLELPAEVRRQLRDRRLRPDPRVPDGLGLRTALPQGPQRRPGHHPRRLAGQRHLGHVHRHAVQHRRHQQRDGVPGLRLDPDQLRGEPEAVGDPTDFTTPVLRQEQVLAADRSRHRGLRHHEAELLPPAGPVERRPLALQGVPDGALPSGVPVDIVQPLQPRELGRAEHDVHVAELPAVLAEQRGHDGDARLPPHPVGLPRWASRLTPVRLD